VHLDNPNDYESRWEYAFKDDREEKSGDGGSRVRNPDTGVSETGHGFHGTSATLAGISRALYWQDWSTTTSSK